MGNSHKITLHNPIDVLGDASAFDYKQVISQTIKEKDIGSIFVLLTPQANTEIKKQQRLLRLFRNILINQYFQYLWESSQ